MALSAERARCDVGTKARGGDGGRVDEMGGRRYVERNGLTSGSDCETPVY